MKLAQTVYETVPAGRYAAVVRDVEPDEGNWGTYLKITFQLDNGTDVTGAASAKFSSRSKLYKWVKAILGGKPIPKGWDLDTDTLIGRRCEIVVDISETDDGEFNRIEMVLPASGNAAPAPVAPAPSVEDVPFEFPESPTADPF